MGLVFIDQPCLQLFIMSHFPADHDQLEFLVFIDELLSLTSLSMLVHVNFTLFQRVQLSQINFKQIILWLI